uniref:Uncharacterized protein LOC116943786 n=1 Tax=Petromyzon marinus TaxID=7757 RepID=A0AAJ7WWM4_PETMA|nr:uncharacterized protein LOC116943786 [Petromyzon marinus]
MAGVLPDERNDGRRGLTETATEFGEGSSSDLDEGEFKCERESMPACVADITNDTSELEDFEKNENAIIQDGVNDEAASTNIIGTSVTSEARGGDAGHLISSSSSSDDDNDVESERKTTAAESLQRERAITDDRPEAVGAEVKIEFPQDPPMQDQQVPMATEVVESVIMIEEDILTVIQTTTVETEELTADEADFSLSEALDEPSERDVAERRADGGADNATEVDVDTEDLSVATDVIFSDLSLTEKTARRADRGENARDAITEAARGDSRSMPDREFTAWQHDQRKPVKALDRRNNTSKIQSSRKSQDPRPDPQDKNKKKASGRSAEPTKRAVIRLRAPARRNGAGDAEVSHVDGDRKVIDGAWVC